jgi:hypothetical protein
LFLFSLPTEIGREVWRKVCGLVGEGETYPSA